MALRSRCAALAHEAGELRQLMGLAQEEGDGDFFAECEERLESFWEDSRTEVIDLALAQSPAASDCFLEVHSGEGGLDAMDWCRMLVEMYEEWSAQRGLRTERVGAVPGDASGFRSLTLHVAGAPAFGLLAPEAGAHRLIRQSPFDRRGRRHTSFAVVLVLEDAEEKSTAGGTMKDIPKSDLKVETMRASGPGGQSVNMSETAVRVTHLPSGVVVKCQREASQIDNLKIAMKWLVAKLKAREAADRRQQRAEIYTSAALEASAAAERRVRTYTLYPRELVKDHRSGLAVADAGGVLSGDGLDPFLECGVLWAWLQHFQPSR